MKALPKYAPYIIFGLENREAIGTLIDGAKGIVASFRRRFPEVPESQTPDEKDVAAAIAASSSGKAGPALAAKKVRDWSPDEWQIFWNQGDRPSGQ